MTQPCGELLPDDVMIVRDCGKLPNGIQQISTVARALSIRQTPETTKANAEFICRAVNSHENLIKALTDCLGCIEAAEAEGLHELIVELRGSNDSIDRLIDLIDRRLLWVREYATPALASAEPRP